MMTPFDAIRSPLEGRNLLEASAGTGKTYAIAALYVRLILEKALSVEQILVVTYTIAATEELRDRIRRRLVEAQQAFEFGCSDDPLFAELLQIVEDHKAARQRLNEALSGFDQSAIFTIHGFCQRVLTENAFETGNLFDTELVSDVSPLLQQVVAQYYRTRFYSAPAGFVSYLRAKNVVPDTLVSYLTPLVGSQEAALAPDMEEPRPDDEEERCRALFERTAQRWAQEREGVMDLLLNSPALNRSRYRPSSISGWGQALDRYLRYGDAVLPCSELEKFCASKIHSAVKKGHLPPEHPFFELCDELTEAQAKVTEGFDTLLRWHKRQLVDHVRYELKKRKETENVRAFDDLLQDLNKALSTAGGPELGRQLRERYQAALIDEFQDTDPVQFAIFAAIYPDSSCPLFLIGDPKQAIYSFRGADIFAYMAARHHIDHQYTLDRNWRSSPRLIEAVNRAFQFHEAPFVFPEIAYTHVHCGETNHLKTLVVNNHCDSAPMQIWPIEPLKGKAVSAERAVTLLSGAVAREIVQLLQQSRQGATYVQDEGGKRKPLRAGDMAVLVRTNRQARVVQKALQRAGVPSVLYSSESVFESREAQGIFRVLSAVADPFSDGKVRAALATDLFGCSGSDLADLAHDERAWEERLLTFARYNTLWSRSGFMIMASALMAEQKVRARLLRFVDGDRRLTNMMHLFEILHRAALDERFGIEGLLKWLVRQMQAKRGREEYEVRLESDEDAVKLVTIHKSKGLEYPVVFCPFCWGGSKGKNASFTYHDPDEGNRLTRYLDDDGASRPRNLAQKEILAENLRLLYVALTRAKYRCYVAWGLVKGAESSALAYLWHGGGLPTDASVVSSLEKQFSALDFQAFQADLDRLVASSGDCVAMAPVPEPNGMESAPAPEHDPSVLQVRPFTATIAQEWRVTSFSALVAGKAVSVEKGGWDEPSEQKSVPVAVEPVERKEWEHFIDFPAGAAAGSCIHEIFEEIDFQAPASPLSSQVIEQKLERFGFDALWQQAIENMVSRVLEHPLPQGGDDFHLGRLSLCERLHEMEFMFPADRIEVHLLQQAFRQLGTSISGTQLQRLTALTFSPCRGFVRGFIDLIFESGGRFYLLDWKTNRLGFTTHDYRPECLDQTMAEELYFIQHYLYSVALHRYLKQRISGYSYDEHFGGGFYLFLRGMSLAGTGEPECGVYFERPERSAIETLSRYFEGGGV